VPVKAGISGGGRGMVIRGIEWGEQFTLDIDRCSIHLARGGGRRWCWSTFGDHSTCSPHHHISCTFSLVCCTVHVYQQGPLKVLSVGIAPCKRWSTLTSLLTVVLCIYHTISFLPCLHSPCLSSVVVLYL